MEKLVGALLSGLVLGSGYGLFAVGLALVLGTMRILNLGHPVLFVMGGYAALMISDSSIRDLAPVPLLVIVGGALAGVLTGLVLDIVCLAPLRRRGTGDDLTVALTTVGFTLAAVSALGLIYGTDPKGIGFPRHVMFRIGTATITETALISVIVAVVLFGVLYWVMRSSTLGLAIRTVAESGPDAELIGLNPRRITRITILVASGIAGIGGALYATNISAVGPYTGEDLLIKGAAIVVVGGLGSVSGSIIISYLLGVAETLTVIYLDAHYQEVVAMTLLVVVLVFRPHGLFGRSELHRV